MAVVNIRDAEVTVSSGGSEEATLHIADGNVTYTERRNIEYIMDRGKLDEVRNGDEAPVEVSINATWKYVDTTSGAGADDDVETIVKGTGGLVSTDTDTCRPYACDIEIACAPDCSGSGVTTSKTITLPDFRWESFEFNVKDGTIAISGKCNTTAATVVNV